MGTSYCVAGEIPLGAAIDQSTCLVLFIILGILMASLYASGKSPLASIDITTPKKPGGKFYFPGYLSAKYKLPSIGRGKIMLSSGLLASRLLKDSALTRAELNRITLKANARKSSGKLKSPEDKDKEKYDALLQHAIKTNLDRVIDEQLNKLYPRANAYKAAAPRAMTPEQKIKSKELEKEIKSLEAERKRKVELVSKINDLLKDSMKARIASTAGELHSWAKLSTEGIDNLKELAEQAKAPLLSELKKGNGEVSTILNKKMKEIAKAPDDPTIDLFAPILTSKIKVELARKGIEKELQAESAKSPENIDREKMKYMEAARRDLEGHSRNIDNMLKKIENEVAQKERNLEIPYGLENLGSEVGRLEKEIEDFEFKKELKEIEPDNKIVREFEGSKEKKKELEEKLKEKEKEYEQELSGWRAPGSLGIIVLKNEKERMLSELIAHEENISNMKCIDILVSEGINETIKIAGKIEAAKIKLGKDIEREGVD
jgi:hypothetical protein